MRSNLSEAAETLQHWARSEHKGADFHFLNAYSIALAEQDPAFRACLEDAQANYPDGKPLSVLTSFSQHPLSQVRGPSLFELVMDKGRQVGLRHFLLGSTPETLNALVASLKRRHPGVQIVGAFSPPFRPLTPDEQARQDSKIRMVDPDIVWVGLGTPKQDFEAQRLAGAGFTAAAVGAAFDFSAGTKREAPQWMTRVGMEWLFRFASEPKRLWRRYLIGNAIFLLAIARRWKTQ